MTKPLKTDHDGRDVGNSTPIQRRTPPQPGPRPFSRQQIVRWAAFNFLLALNSALPDAAARADDIVITVAGPASGPQSVRAQAILAGARKAADAVNAGDGVKGARVRVAFADDGCDAGKAKALAEELALKKVDLVLGHPCARAGIAATAVYAETGTVFIATASRHATAAPPAKAATIFRLAGRDERQGAEAAAFLAASYKGRTIAVVHDRTRAQRAIADAATDALVRLGAGTPIMATLTGGDKDFPLLTAKIKSAAAIFFAGYPIEAGLLYSQLRKAGANPAFLMSDSNATSELTDTFGDGVAGVYVMRPRFGLTEPHDTNEAAATGDAEARILAADATLAEAAVIGFAAAAHRADSVNPDTIARELTARAYSTAHGNVRFDETGEAERPSYDVYKWTGKAWEGASSGPLDP